MDSDGSNRHSARSAQTRARFIDAAETLFAERGVESVSLNEITVSAGQRNRNALQYHFGNREGLLQAIIDRHAETVHRLRLDYMAGAAFTELAPAQAAARALVMPLAQHIETDPAGAHYVKILSQLAALNSDIVNPSTRSGLTLAREDQLAGVMRDALAHLDRDEARRRLFLVVSMTFHSLADICRASEAPDTDTALADSPALFAQVALAVESLLSAPALEG